MNYKVKTTGKFDRDIKKLSKKFPSLKVDMNSLIDELEINPTIGTSLGKNAYKIRLAITSKNKGKSSGARQWRTSNNQCCGL